MTFFLDFRSAAVGGSAIAPKMWQGTGVTDPLDLKFVDPSAIPALVANRNLLFVAHGFNVNRAHGAYSIGTLDSFLGLSSPNLLIGVLWPGDSWIPIVDYPFEGNVALATGRLLAGFCNTQAAGALSLSFVSHSLGARVVLEAIKNLTRTTVRSLCLTAGAVNRDCLTREYVSASKAADAISNLASDRDLVLRLAYSLGDPFADLLHDDHSFFEAALGYKGPPVPVDPPVTPWQIPDALDYTHGSYLPKQGGDTKWQQAAAFMKRAFFALPQGWPGEGKEGKGSALDPLGPEARDPLV